MMSKPFFSVIIPVWKPDADSLQRCLQSVLYSCNEPCEILLIDDGNEGEYLEILNRTALMFSAVKVVHLPHGGVSRARNQGAALAGGSYVTYLDADDELTPGILKRVEGILKRDPVSLLITRIARTVSDEQGTKERETGGQEGKGLLRVFRDPVIPFDDRAGIGLNRLRKYYLTMKDPLLNDGVSWINRAVHGRFVRAELARETAFREDLAFGEDVIWNFALTDKADSILLSDQTGYCYHKNQSSATQAYRDQFPAEVSRLLSIYRKMISEWDLSLRRYYDCAVVEYFTILCRVYVFAGPEETRRKRFMKQVRDPLWQRSFYRVKSGLMKKKYELVAALGRTGSYEALYFLCRLHYSRV